MRSNAEVRRRPLVTIVGTFSETRVELARRLLDGGAAVSLCAGPPSCSLLRGDPCPLLGAADATVVLPTDSRDRIVIEGLSLCAANAPRCIVVEPTTIDRDLQTVHARFWDIERLAAFMGSVLGRLSRGGRADSPPAKN